MSGEETETIQINISDEQSNAVLKEAMMHHFDGREVAEDVVAADGTVLIEAGATYDEAIIDAILANGTVRDVKFAIMQSKVLRLNRLPKVKINKLLLNLCATVS